MERDKGDTSKIPFIIICRCHICREVFQLAAVLGNHLATAHPSEVNAAVALVDAKAKSTQMASKPMQQQQQQQIENTNSSSAGSVRNKSVWCPVCNQGFTRQYNLKVGKMFKSLTNSHLFRIEIEKVNSNISPTLSGAHV